MSVDHVYSDFMIMSSSSFSRVSEFVISDAASSCHIFQQKENVSSKKEAGVERAEKGPRHGRRLKAANSQGPY